jgi:hypothetical protein
MPEFLIVIIVLLETSVFVFIGWHILKAIYDYIKSIK